MDGDHVRRINTETLSSRSVIADARLWGGLFAQALKAHTVIGLVVAAERYGRGESRVVHMFNFVPALHRA